MGRRTVRTKRHSFFPGVVAIGLLLGIAVFFFGGQTTEAGEKDAKQSPAVGVQEKRNIDQTLYSTINMTSSDLSEGSLILICQDVLYSLSGAEAFPSVYDEKTGSYQVKDKNVLLRSDVTQALNRMCDAFQAEKGENDLIVISGHRTLEYQQGLYDKRVSEEGEEAAKGWVALPGASEHHAGYALDFGLYSQRGVYSTFTGTGKYEWLCQNAWQYGFIVRYDENKKDITGINYEPWHFRYLGEIHAEIITGLELTLEEYTDYLRQFSFGECHLETEQAEIYFVKADGTETQVPIPLSGDYEISGNNADGFIVTIIK